MDDFETAEIETDETRIFVRRRIRAADPAAARLPADTPDVARRRAAAGPRLYGRLRRPARLRRAAAARPPRRTMRRMRSEPWRETWWPSWSGLGFRASRSPGMIAAVASPIAWRWTIPNGSSGLPFSTSCRPRPSGSGPTRGSRSAYWPWSLLAQPEPLPERILAAAPEAIIDNALGGWGSPAAVFPPEVRAAYVAGAARSRATPTPSARSIAPPRPSIASMTRRIVRRGRRIACPLLALWSARGPLDTWYAEEAGPLALWRAWGDDVQATRSMPATFSRKRLPSRPPTL